MQVAAVQMVSTPVVAENLAAAGVLIDEAVAAGARLVALPEYFAILGRKETDKVAAAERPGEGPIQDFLSRTARQHAIWLVGGSVPVVSGVPGKVFNACLVYGPDGARVARYDKIHLFGLDLGAERFSEARTIVPGRTVASFDMAGARVGLSICYDIRFPELYRALGVTDLILAPAAFTATTGEAHWETLLRARAIENQAYVLAPAQGGEHPNGRRTHGHSMIVDPWGRVLAECASGAGVVRAAFDAEEVRRVRAALPALQHRVLT
ncbi:MAG: carbon-nitrogen hydrolase family protein [Burkholderiales bacterium]